jgi:hypothetical protein
MSPQLPGNGEDGLEAASYDWSSRYSFFSIIEPRRSRRNIDEDIRSYDKH